MSDLQEILGPSTKIIGPAESGGGSGVGQSDTTIKENETVQARIAKNMEVYYYNPWAMVEDGIIYTLDQTDLLNPIKPFPKHPWLKEVTTQWLDSSLIAVYKSRRMTMSWLMMFLHLWLVMFREGAAVFIVSDKEDKSNELVKRAEFIYNHIPDDMVLKPRMKPTYCKMDFPGLNSYMLGVPQGANQLRQFTATAILADEFAFWERARETFMASKPTIDGGGKFTAISSPQEGFFKDICFDLIR